MSVIDDYLKKVSPTQKVELEKIRRIVEQMVPDYEDTIGYGMPVIKYKGKYLIGFAAFKNHMSIFPGAEPVEKMKSDLGKFKISKGTVQFTTNNLIPSNLLEEIIKICKARIDRN